MTLVLSHANIRYRVAFSGLKHTNRVGSFLVYSIVSVHGRSRRRCERFLPQKYFLSSPKVRHDMTKYIPQDHDSMSARVCFVHHYGMNVSLSL
jgi:hypothetical protein